MHTRLGGFCTRARQQNVSDDFAGRHIADLIKMFRIQFDRDAGGKLAFDRRDPVELKLERQCRFSVLESGQIVRGKIPRHQKLLRLELLLLLSDRAEDVDDNAAGLRQVQLGQFRHAECWIYR